MIVTIDGPAGSGKSTVARRLAARLELSYLDTGAMYRALAYLALKRGVDVGDSAALEQMAKGATLKVDCGPTHTRVRIDGHDVSEVIRSMSVTEVTSDVARHGAIRDLLVAQQRRLGAELGSFVTEGRDQGSVVFPEADVKFVIEASLQRRASRRFAELQVEEEAASIEAVEENLKSRDLVDSKQWAPLLERGEAIVIDTTDMTIVEVVERMVALLPGGSGTQ